MARSTQLADGLHVVKPYKSGTSCTITIPAELAAEMKIEAGLTYMAVRRIGGCLVITRITDVSENGAKAEFSDALAELGPDVGQAEVDRTQRRTL